MHVFDQFHRKKIERFIENSDRYYRLHIRSKMVDGGYVSGTQLQASPNSRCLGEVVLACLGVIVIESKRNSNTITHKPVLSH